ncbi:MAG: transposase [Ardenticatenaceae bacterium]|nr:transposase [Ardenticatenaceae bacterium]
MLKTFEYRLYPSKSQERLMGQTLETCRRWYNICLAERKDAWEQAQQSVGKFAQLAKVKDYRKENPFAGQVHSHVLQVVVADLDKAFQAFFRRAKAGEAPGYPRFKGRNRFDSFGFKEYGNGFKLDGRRLRLFGIGRVAVRWHRPIEGKVKTLRIKRKAGKWYACFACEVEPEPLPETGKAVGLDVGIASLITTSEGEKVENPKWYRTEQRQLRVAQRRVARRKKGSARRRKAVLALQCQHERIRTARKDFLNKLAADLVNRYDLIAIEDLQISNMVHNRHLSKSILDAGWGYFRQRLSFKAEEAGRTVVEVNPAHTSKTCSHCGSLFAELTPADRWVECECGLSLDRDHNAAINILKRAGQVRQALTYLVGDCVA